MDKSSARPGSEALQELRRRFEQSVPPELASWWQDAASKAQGGDAKALETLLPGLRRRFGAEPFVEPTDHDRFLQSRDFVLDLAAYRRCDLAGVLLASAAMEGGADPAFLRVLFDQGDTDERSAVLRTLAVTPEHPVVAELLGEAQRANTQDLVEAAFCDSDLIVRRLDQEDFNRAIVKMAFVDLPVWRVIRGTERANAELSRMLQDFATEREAAGRPVWIGTLPLIAKAPVPGTMARLVGHLEHGDDYQRQSAAESIADLGDAGVARFVRERMEREPRPKIRELLTRAAAKLEG